MSTAQTTSSSATAAPLSVGDVVLAPGSQATAHTAGQTLSGPAPLHLIYVHGIGQVGPGDSSLLRQGICEYFHECLVSSDPPVYAEGPFSLDSSLPDLAYLQQPVWSNREEWNAAAPYFQRFHLSGNPRARPIVLDELNWYPLVYALKCKFLLPVDERLIGTMKTQDAACRPASQPDPHSPSRFLAYQWVPDQAILQTSLPQANATLINHGLKSSVLDWNLSDAAMAIGSMQQVLCAAIRQLLAQSLQVPLSNSESAGMSAGNEDVPVFFVTHSLGSFLSIMAVDSEWAGADADRTPQFAITPAQKDAADFFAEHSTGFFFLANQLAFLELAGLTSAVPAADCAAAPGPSQKPAGTASNAIAHYGCRRQKYLASHPQAGDGKVPPQIVAWSDADDLLSWYVPRLPQVTSVNHTAHNSAFRIPWLFANPGSVHANYAKNRHVIRAILKPTRHPPLGGPQP